jgi:type VI secretion system secreted protein VgrG
MAPIINSAPPESYLKEVLRWEGGYVNDPDDRGGETNRGITIGALSKAKSQGLVPQTVTIKSLTTDLDSVKKIYEVNYYKAGKCDKMPHPLAYAHFDACVHHGLAGAGKLLQKMIVSFGQKIAVDGAVGPKTLSALETLTSTKPVASLCAEYNMKREERYRAIVRGKPSQAKFLKGWLNRLNSVRAFCANG